MKSTGDIGTSSVGDGQSDRLGRSNLDLIALQFRGSMKGGNLRCVDALPLAVGIQCEDLVFNVIRFSIKRLDKNTELKLHVLSRFVDAIDQAGTQRHDNRKRCVDLVGREAITILGSIDLAARPFRTQQWGVLEFSGNQRRQVTGLV